MVSRVRVQNAPGGRGRRHGARKTGEKGSPSLAPLAVVPGSAHRAGAGRPPLCLRRGGPLRLSHPLLSGLRRDGRSPLRPLLRPGTARRRRHPDGAGHPLAGGPDGLLLRLPHLPDPLLCGGRGTGAAVLAGDPGRHGPGLAAPSRDPGPRRFLLPPGTAAAAGGRRRPEDRGPGGGRHGGGAAFDGAAGLRG